MKGYNFFFPWCVLCREARGFLDMPKEIYFVNLREGEMGGFPLKFIINGWLSLEILYKWVAYHVLS